eukprot:4820040-Karenia_brevis.AAC.1
MRCILAFRSLTHYKSAPHKWILQVTSVSVDPQQMDRSLPTFHCLISEPVLIQTFVVDPFYLQLPCLSRKLRIQESSVNVVPVGFPF